jgi:soluble lytic murein transglycosylase
MAREPHIVDQSLFWAGKTAEHLGDFDQAGRFYRRAAQGFPRSYYSARAVALGHRRKAALTPRPPRDLRPGSETQMRQIQGVEYLKRADALHQLGLTDLARREMQAAERLNSGAPPALRLIRDRYELLGLLDSALRLSVRLFVGQGNQGEIHRIYPNYYWDQIVQVASEEEIDPYLVLSVIRQESSFNEEAVSRAGALGLMQIMPQTGRTLAHSLGMQRFERRSLFDPEVSIRLGSRFLGDQVRHFTAGPAQDLGFELGLAAYNAGPHNARRWLKRIPYEDPDAFIERIPYHETRLYVKLVLKNYTIYKALSDA